QWQSNGNPYSGKSYNIYNTALKRWEQFWVDNVGGNIFFYGNLKDGVMDYYTGELPQPDGTNLKRYLQFFKLGPDKVRQFSQGSPDNEKPCPADYDLRNITKKYFGPGPFFRPAGAQTAPNPKTFHPERMEPAAGDKREISLRLGGGVFFLPRRQHIHRHAR